MYLLYIVGSDAHFQVTLSALYRCIAHALNLAETVTGIMCTVSLLLLELLNFCVRISYPLSTPYCISKFSLSFTWRSISWSFIGQRVDCCFLLMVWFCTYFLFYFAVSNKTCGMFFVHPYPSLGCLGHYAYCCWWLYLFPSSCHAMPLM
jgi:hypothetical protein